MLVAAGLAWRNCGLLAGIAAVVVALPLVLVGAIVGGLSGSMAGASGGFGPSSAALADIPEGFLTMYQEAAAEYGLDWAYLAAIGKVETDHGRLRAPGVTSGVNAYGCCAGPMQFMITGANGGTWGAYGVDGNGDGRKSVYDPADAIPAAARYLKASGAPDDMDRAILAYNHANWYVVKVKKQAEEYRGALGGDAGGLSTLATARGNARSVLMLANGPRPRIVLRPTHRQDLQGGRIDPRVSTLLLSIAEKHTITISSLRSDHGYYTSGNKPSNHAFGRAVDIAVVDGDNCAPPDRRGGCWQLAQELDRTRGVLHPDEIIYFFDPGPSPESFAAADHDDHIHAGYGGGS